MCTGPKDLFSFLSTHLCGPDAEQETELVESDVLVDLAGREQVVLDHAVLKNLDKGSTIQRDSAEQR